jgi:hypothetical protein
VGSERLSQEGAGGGGLGVDCQLARSVRGISLGTVVDLYASGGRGGGASRGRRDTSSGAGSSGSGSAGPSLLSLDLGCGIIRRLLLNDSLFL